MVPGRGGEVLLKREGNPDHDEKYSRSRLVLGVVLKRSSGRGETVLKLRPHAILLV